MLVTDAVNEVMLQGVPISGLEINVKGNVVLLRDEFGLTKRLFADNDPDIVSKLRSFWGDFLADRSRRRLERMGNDITSWYEVHCDAYTSEKVDTIEAAELIAVTLIEKGYCGVKMLRFTSCEIPLQ